MLSIALLTDDDVEACAGQHAGLSAQHVKNLLVELGGLMQESFSNPDIGRCSHGCLMVVPRVSLSLTVIL